MQKTLFYKEPFACSIISFREDLFGRATHSLAGWSPQEKVHANRMLPKKSRETGLSPVFSFVMMETAGKPLL
ncbi:MAG: hypothetical protein GY706_04490 [Bacteroides sp.]|nr:hypothetical protein [Bacteroides sp.]